MFQSSELHREAGSHDEPKPNLGTKTGKPVVETLNRANGASPTANFPSV